MAANQNSCYYVDAINLCGGFAEVQYCPEVSTDYDGLVLCEGNDIDPSCYNQENCQCENIDHQRAAAEFALAKAFIEAKKPIMGICHGA